MEAIRRYTIALLSQDGFDDMQNREAREIECINDMLNGKPYDGEVRRFPIQAAAHLELEHAFLEDMNNLLTRHEMWDDLIDDSQKTLHTNCEIFRLWSGLEAGVARFSIEPNLQMPTRLFVIDEFPEAEDEIMGVGVLVAEPYVYVRVRT